MQIKQIVSAIKKQKKLYTFLSDCKIISFFPSSISFEYSSWWVKDSSYMGGNYLLSSLFSSEEELRTSSLYKETVKSYKESLLEYIKEEKRKIRNARESVRRRYADEEKNIQSLKKESIANIEIINEEIELLKHSPVVETKTL